MKKSLLLYSCIPLSFLTAQESWNVDANGNWSSATNWSPNVVPNAASTQVTFGNVTTAVRTVTLDISPIVGSIIFNSSNGYQISPSGANSLTLNAGGSNATIQLPNTNNAAQQISVPMTLLSNLAITQNSNASLNLGGVISGPTSMTVSASGAGFVILSASHTFTGGLTINSGTVQCSTNSALAASSNVVLNGGVLDINGTTQTIQSLLGSGSVTLGAGSLTINTTGATTYSGQISGAGSLTLSGQGSLTLTTVNSYTGATNVTGGNLILGVANALNSSTALTVTSPGVFNLNNFSQTVSSIAGSGGISLGTATLTIGGNNSTTFSGVISGTGSLVHSGTSTTTLSGVNTYKGGTTLSGGTVQLGVSEALPSGQAVQITGGILNLNNFTQTVGNFTATAGSVALGTGQLIVGFSGSNNLPIVISGAGSVVFQGPGTWTYGAAQSYTGGTTISGGILRMGIANALASTGAVILGSSGVLDMDNNDLTIAALGGSGGVSLGSGHLTFNTTNTITGSFNGSITGSGALLVTGSGKQILTGQNSYTGGTTVNAGATLQGTTTGLQGHIVNHGTLIFNQSLSGLFAGLISGTGQLQMQAGTVVLQGANTQSSLWISGGDLVIASGSTFAANPITILSGGTLSGDGVVTGNVANSGTIFPRGILSVNGDVSFQNGSFLATDLTPQSATLLAVSGNTTLQSGSKVYVTVTPGNYAGQTRYLILTSGGGAVNGQFDSAQVANPFFNVDFIYNQIEPGSIEIDVTIRPIGDVIKGGNAGAIAHCLSPQNLTKDADLASIVSKLIFLPLKDVVKVLGQMQPSELRALTTEEQNGALFAQTLLSQRTGDFDRSDCQKMIAERKNWALWTTLGGHWTRQSSENSNIGYYAPSAGLMIGFDGKVAPHLYLGAALEYGHTSLKWEHQGGSATINRMSIGPYLSYLGRFGYLNLSILGGFAHFNAYRNIPFFQRIATSSHNGATLLSHIDAGLVFHPANQISLTPFVSIDGVGGWETSFKESDAGSLSFSIQDTTSYMLRSEVGIKVSKCAIRSHGRWVNDLKASWVRQERFKGKELHAQFRQFGCGFKVDGLYPSENLLDLGMGLSYLFKEDRMGFSLRYEGMFGHRVALQSGVAQLTSRY